MTRNEQFLRRWGKVIPPWKPKLPWPEIENLNFDEDAWWDFILKNPIQNHWRCRHYFKPIKLTETNIDQETRLAK